MEGIQNQDSDFSARRDHDTHENPITNSLHCRDDISRHGSTKSPQSPRRSPTDPINISSALTTPSPSRAPSPVHQNADDGLRRLFQMAAWTGAPKEITNKCDLFIDAQLEPPVTRKGLRPLETLVLVNSIKLRFDMNHNSDISYRKMDGAERNAKAAKAESYWQAVELELKLYAYLPTLFSKLIVSRDMDLHKARSLCKRRIPALLREIRDIVCTLVPKKDQEEVKKTWECDLMMQEIMAGCCDFRSRASSLTTLLLKHIAPCRDKSIKAVEELIHNGEITAITAGLAELLSTLESCRLDCANHMLRQFKAQFIDGTVNFAVKLISRCIEKDRVDAWSIRSWFLQNKERSSRSPALIDAAVNNTDLSVFVDAFIKDVTPSSTELLPQPFVVDADRIQAGRSAILQHIQMRICYLYFEAYVHDYCLDAIVVSEVPAELSKKFLNLLRSMVKARGSLISEISNITTEIAQCVSQLRGDADNDFVHDLQEEIEENLACALDPNYETFQEEEKRIQEKLTLLVFETTQKFLNAPLYEVHQRLVLQSPIPPPLQGLAPQHDGWQLNHDLETISNRFAHIALIHFKVFGGLIYLNKSIDGPNWLQTALNETDEPGQVDSDLDIVKYNADIIYNGT